MISTMNNIISKTLKNNSYRLQSKLKGHKLSSKRYISILSRSSQVYVSNAQSTNNNMNKNHIKLYSQVQTVRTIDKKGLKSLITLNEDYILIDVREANELRESGFIKTSRNLPLSELRSAFLMDEKSFEDKYRFMKPNKNDKIVLYCSCGGRSQEASLYISSLGYSNVYNYSGSYMDWIKPLPPESI